MISAALSQNVLSLVSPEATGQTSCHFLEMPVTLSTAGDRREPFLLASISLLNITPWKDLTITLMTRKSEKICSAGD